MAKELRTSETVALVAAELRGHARALADEYGRFRSQCEKEPAPPAGEAKSPKLDLKEFQARHVAGKAVLAHMELLLRIARTIDGVGGAAEESEEDLEAEAARNLARPA